MQKRKLVTMAGALALIGALGVGATLAYFTDNASVGNVITMSHVDIKLTETATDEETGENVLTEEGLTIDGVIPGATFDKDPTATVQEGSANCYVRMNMEFKVPEGSKITEDDLAALQTLLNAQILESKDWTYNEDGYYYFASELAAGGQAVLFDDVTIPVTWKNNTADQTFNIIVTAEAIQSEHTDEVVTKDGDGKVTGWALAADQIEKYSAN